MIQDYDREIILNNKKIIILVFITLMVAAYTNLYSANNSADLETGRKLYLDLCAGCHGNNAEGQIPERRGGGLDENNVPIAPALNGTAHTWHHPPKLLFRYIDKGSIMKGSPMPAFGDTLNKQEILSIISYFQSLWSEKRRQWYLEKYKDK